MKNILILTIALLAFTACSDKGSAIALTAPCNSTNDTTDYQVLQSGDVIAKSSSTEPEVEIFHTEDGLKKVCIQSGTAMILR